MGFNIQNKVLFSNNYLKIFIIIIILLLTLSNLMPVAVANADNGKANAYGRIKNAGKNDKPTFIYVDGYEPWAVKVVNAGNPHGVDLVTVDLNETSKTLTITAQDSNSTNKATILVNRLFIETYITNINDNIEFNLTGAVNYKGINSSNSTGNGPAVYVFHIKHFSTVQIVISSKEAYLPSPESDSSTLSLGGFLGILSAITVVIVAMIYMFRQEKGRSRGKY